MSVQYSIEEDKGTSREVDERGELKDTGGNIGDYDSVIDICEKSFDFPVLEETEAVSNSIEGLYMYKNVFTLMPRSIAGLGRLRTLKFFANEINLVPPEFRNLVDLECLQVKVSLPGLNGLNLHKLKSLKELELSKVPSRPSAFPIVSEIAVLKGLTKLSVCHFSIRYLPPEIGCLKNLEYLDLSFNKMRSLPTEITYLSSLVLLKIASNKLIELPSGFSSLQSLENLDLSNNRLTSLACLKLDLMHSLRRLDLQNNILHRSCQIPEWVYCSLEGNSKNAFEDGECICSSAEMDVLEGSVSKCCESFRNRSTISSSHLTGSSTNGRGFATRRSSKVWKRRYYLQQRARQVHLNNSRKKGDNYTKQPTQKVIDKFKRCKHTAHASDSVDKCSSSSIGVNMDKKELLPMNNCDTSKADVCGEVHNDSTEFISTLECDSALRCLSSSATGVHDEGSLSESELHKCNFTSKRLPDGDLDNPKPSKARRPARDCSALSCKYSNKSFCSSDDFLLDGFYDAGRDRPFLPLSSYEKKFNIDSREVILVDRERDEHLDAIGVCAQALIYHFKQVNYSIGDREQVHFDSLQVASLLALFVSDRFGGSDKNAVIERTRKAVSGSNYRKPFVCTCLTGNNDDTVKSPKEGLDAAEDIVFLGLCEKALQSTKAKHNSIVVPLGSVQFGVCRHRALLMKYLCDRMEPQIPCELVRGYLDFSPHAWNVIIVKKVDSWVRLIVDACRPYDIREERDPEYCCRYIPLSRVNIQHMTDDSNSPNGSFPSLSASDKIGNGTSTSLIGCKLGSLEAVAKVRTLKVCGSSPEEIKNFEFSCLGEVRMLSALKHSCIVQVYGHQISSNWAVLDGTGSSEGRTLQSSILMEHINGGSLKNYMEKLSRSGKKHVPVSLVLCIARDIASALAELHSKHIIHRDIKSENVLIDLDKKRADGSPVVKLCDFDRAIPLRSYLHSCCIAHVGVPFPDVCVGTPRWMAPEVFRSMNKRELYGLEVDIWSFGCMLLELLTLQVPYSGLPETEICELLQMGKRPQLTAELEALVQPAPIDQSTKDVDGDGPDDESEILRFLVDMFRQCTMENPNERPQADNLCHMLLVRARSVTSSGTLERE